MSTLKKNIIIHGPYHGSVKEGSKSRSLLGSSPRFRRVARIACAFKQTLIEWIRPSTAVILYWLYLYALASFSYDEQYHRVFSLHRSPYSPPMQLRRCCLRVFAFGVSRRRGEVMGDVNNSGLATSCIKKAYLHACAYCKRENDWLGDICTKKKIE